MQVCAAILSLRFIFSKFSVKLCSCRSHTGITTIPSLCAQIVKSSHSNFKRSWFLDSLPLLTPSKMQRCPLQASMLFSCPHASLTTSKRRKDSAGLTCTASVLHDTVPCSPCSSPATSGSADSASGSDLGDDGSPLPSFLSVEQAASQQIHHR